jgi:hypothetical protein
MAKQAVLRKNLHVCKLLNVNELHKNFISKV